jgi:aspartate beta-hydroxylase
MAEPVLLNPGPTTGPSPAQALLDKGDIGRAIALLEAARAQRPDAGTLALLGQLRLRMKDYLQAQACFEEWGQLEPRSPQPCVYLAMAFKGLGQNRAQASALRRALEAEPRHLMALLMEAQRLETSGPLQEALAAHAALVAVADSSPEVPVELRPAVEKSRQRVRAHERARAQALEAALAVARDSSTHADSTERIELGLDIMLGRKRRFDPQPMQFYVPHLRQLEFYPRSEFPWLAAIESKTAAITQECLQVVQEDLGLEPYLTYPEHAPLDQWRELNQSLRWSAFHLIKDGEVVQANARRCPATMAALAQAPQPVQPGRTPSAMFSILKPGTHIPPHVGVSNARLVVHIPLVIPPDCGFRVGNQTRIWSPGQALVFDDSIEHEAWNRSDHWRALLIFDIWHPDLSESERACLSALSRAETEFSGRGGDHGL